MNIVPAEKNPSSLVSALCSLGYGNTALTPSYHSGKPSHLSCEKDIYPVPPVDTSEAKKKNQRKAERLQSTVPQSLWESAGY